MKRKAMQLLEKVTSLLPKADDQGARLLNDIHLILDIMKSNVDLVELCVWLQLTTRLTDSLKHLKTKNNKVQV